MRPWYSRTANVDHRAERRLPGPLCSLLSNTSFGLLFGASFTTSLSNKRISPSVSELLANLDIHPLRGDFYDELHSRPFQILPSPARVSHIAVLTNPEQRQSQFQHLQTLYTLLGHVPPQQEVGCFEHTFGDLRVRREMHMEFASYTFVNLAPNRSVAFSENAINLLPEG
jgi:hypothetical protein